MKLPSYLSKSRHGTYYLRLQLGGKDQKVSLRTKDPSIASLAAYRFGAKICAMKNQKTTIKFATPEEILDEENFARGVKNYELQTRALARIKALEDKATEDAYFELLLSKNQHLVDSINNPEIAIKHVASQPVKGKTISQALKEYQAFLESKDQANKTKKMALSVLWGLVKILGEDFNLQEFDDELLEEKWINERLKSVKETTVKRDLTFVKSFIEWCADKKRGYCPSLVHLKMKVEDRHWEYFTKDDLVAIFQHLDVHANKPWKFWIPLIGLYTGARISEIASLKTSAFYEKNLIKVMRLEGTKTERSNREIPIHNDLKRLGLVDFAKARKIANHEYLFDIENSAHNGFGAAPSKWFTQYKRQCGINDDAKVFHSFRHTIVDLMNQLSIDEKSQCQYTGHSENNANVRSKIYGRNPISIPKLNENLVQKINWNQYCGLVLDFVKLRNKANTFY